MRDRKKLAKTRRKEEEKKLGGIEKKLIIDKIIIDSKEKKTQETYHCVRWVASYMVHLPQGTPDMVPIETVCTQLLRNHPGEEDLLCLTSKTEEQQDIQETIETYARASPHGGMEQVRVQEMPDDEQDKKAKEFIDAIRKKRKLPHQPHAEWR